MQRATDVLIMGGGVIGTSIAYHLRKRKIGVTIVERETAGSQASGAAAGLLAPLGPLSGPGPFADLLLSSFALFPELVSELEERSGQPLEYRQTGALRSIRNPKRTANLKKRLDAWQQLGLALYWLTGEEARQREPLLSPDVCAAIYAPQESQIKAPQLVRAFAKAAQNLGAVMYEQTEIIGIQKSGTTVTGVKTRQGETLACKHLVLAPGAWTAQYETWFDITLPVRPLRGQMLSLRAPAVPLKHIIFGEAAYIAPRGQSILIGATKEEAGFDTQVTAEGISWLHETASKFIPALRESSRENAWAGLRPQTPDKWPILGPLPNWENVTLAAGHNSVGIILSPLTGRTIAELVATGHTPEIICPFSLKRFQVERPV